MNPPTHLTAHMLEISHLHTPERERERERARARAQPHSLSLALSRFRFLSRALSLSLSLSPSTLNPTHQTLNPEPSSPNPKPGAPRRRVRRLPGPSSASLGLTDYSQVDLLGLLYNSVNFGADKSPGSIFARQRYYVLTT